MEKARDCGNQGVGERGKRRRKSIRDIIVPASDQSRTLKVRHLAKKDKAFSIGEF